MFSSFQKITKWTVLIVCIVMAVIFTTIAFPSFERVNWYRQIVLTITNPPQKLITSVTGFVSKTWNHYIAITNAAVENDLLKDKLAESNRKLIEMDEVKKENSELQELIGMSKSFKLNGVGVRVIASDVMAEFKTLLIDKGHADGIRKNMVVIGPGGLVGRIGQVSAHEASVLLISDPNSAVDVFVQRSGARALLVGTSHSVSVRPFFSLSRLEYLRRISDVSNGDVVVTSGLDKLFPAGIPVGTIFNLENPNNGIFKSAEVVPFVDLSAVKELLVLK